MPTRPSPPPLRRRAAILLLGLALLASPACRWIAPAPPPLEHTFATPEDAARAVLDRLAVGDRQALRALALSEREFKDHVWPHLPAARPERNLPFSFVWGDLHQKSENHLAVTLARLGGRRFSLVALRFTGPTTDYGPYKVHRKSLLTVRDASGEVRDLRVFGSMLEKDGRYKVFSYVVDD